MSEPNFALRKARSMVEQYLRMSKQDVSLAIHKAVIRKYKGQMYAGLLAHQDALADFLSRTRQPIDFAQAFEKSRARFVKSCLVWPYREKRGLTRSMIKIYGAGGKRHVVKQIEEIDEDEMYDAITDESEEWASEVAGELVVGISVATELQIKRIIAEAVREGWGIPKIKRELMPLIGLDDQRIARLGNYEAELQSTGISGSDLERKLEAFELRMIRQRAETIARTETAAASSEGTLTAFDDMGIEEVEGVSDPECCAECDAEINGQTFTIEEAREMIPYHPNCECTWVAL